MKNVIFAAALVLGFSATSQAEVFSCQMESDKSVVLQGELSENSAVISISDNNNVLDIRELDLFPSIEMVRALRKKEPQYSFAKYYVDFNAWQDLEISVPKVISQKYFKAFLTVYSDDGDFMVPGEANKLNCVKK